MPTNKNNIVKHTLDLGQAPVLSPQQKARLAALAALPDSRIDYSDAPELLNAVWLKASPLMLSPKKQITLRIDADVVDFFKLSGKRYQTRMNAVLRAYTDAHKQAA